MESTQRLEQTDAGLAARRAALDIVSHVLDRKQPLDQTLEEHQGFLALDPRDRAFVRMLATTAIRRKGQVDDIILKATERNEIPKPPLLHNLLRLGVTQILFMNAPDYAVVDTAVNLAETIGLERQKGFVNAVLRRTAKDGRGWLEKQDPSRLNIPEWLLKAWVADFGIRTAAEIAQASLAEAPLDITVKDLSKREQWAQALEATVLPTGSLRRGGGLVTELPGYADGEWWVQDAAAAIPARLFGDVSGKTIIDLCAAPGGKTAQLAALGAQVTALDRSAPRLRRLAQNLERLHLAKSVTTEVADAAIWQPKAPVKFVLLDAPCTATGTIRRHPDVMHLKSPTDEERLGSLQARLLDNAAQMLATGGILIYCTCSLQKAEGEMRVEALLERNNSITRLPVKISEFGGAPDMVTTTGDLRLFPFHMAVHGGCDGFYAARLVKR
ncbi:MAG TPA: RsmB/NOP family class I SAM-dependent RNA methyltransferase [Patescibacteria group bacterium]|nr:RsmB/NOP family class I SAM-dependent RNA methyltransferase [Patescibacteria group bacterium]